MQQQMYTIQNILQNEIITKTCLFKYIENYTMKN